MSDEDVKELDRKIAVMQASKAADIECLRRYEYGAKWVPAKIVNWDWANWDFRVKPVEPRRIFIPALEGILYDNHFTNLVALNAFVCQLKHKSHYNGYVEFVELTPEIKQKLGL